jgi:hypothetical protein
MGPLLATTVPMVFVALGVVSAAGLAGFVCLMRRDRAQLYQPVRPVTALASGSGTDTLRPSLITLAGLADDLLDASGNG